MVRRPVEGSLIPPGSGVALVAFGWTPWLEYSRKESPSHAHIRARGPSRASEL